MKRAAMLAAGLVLCGAAEAQRIVYECRKDGQTWKSPSVRCDDPPPLKAADIPPPGRNMAAEIQAEFERARAAREAAAARAAAQVQAAEQDKARRAQALAACEAQMKTAPRVMNSPWDGSVHQVERFLKREYLRDPDSFEAVAWSPVVRSCIGYEVSVRYRARNGYGGMTMGQHTVTLDLDGNVVGVTK